MLIEIKSWIDGKVLFSGEFENLKEAVIKADLSRANLSGADLSGANLSRANLSGANGLKNFDALGWFRKNFKKCKRGVIVYKAFGLYNTPPETWKIEAGSTISENCGPMPTDECACGVNFATREWIEQAAAKDGRQVTIWRCLIPWAWLPGVVIPWNTDGKARCCKLILLKKEESK